MVVTAIVGILISMKSAAVLSKLPTTFEPIADGLRALGYPFVEWQNTIGTRVIQLTINNVLLTLYDRSTEPDIFEKYEIPQDLLDRGFRFGFFIECRSEEVFCRCISDAARELDVYIYDNDGNLFKPTMLDPTKIVL